MLTRHARALAAAALLVVGPVSAPVGAKPPDLPLPARETCDDERPARVQADTEATRRALADILAALGETELSQRDNIAPVQAACRISEADAAAHVGEALGIGTTETVNTEAAIPGAAGIGAALGLDLACRTPRLAFALGIGAESADEAGAGNIGIALGLGMPGGDGHTTAAAVGMSLVSPVAGSCHLACLGQRDQQWQSGQAHSAQRLFEIGRACEQRGDWAMARSCYEEACRVCPSSEYATAALARIDRLRVVRGEGLRTAGGAEEAEPQQPDLIHESRSDLRRIQESRRMYNLGARYQGKGDWANAHRCFEESHMICPACRYGQDAMERMLYLEHLKARQNGQDGAEEQEPRGERRGAMSDNDFQRREEAHGLYLLGERCRRNGDPTMAYGFYQESHQASPNSYYGQKAIQRIYDIERRRGPRGTEGVEEQEDNREAAAPAAGDYRGFARWMSSR